MQGRSFPTQTEVRLDVDLRLNLPARRAAATVDEGFLDMSTLARAARSPQSLWHLLRRRRFDEVRVTTGDLPLTAVQAACMVFLVATPTRRFLVDGRAQSRGSFAARAVAGAAVAVPAEIVRSALLARRVSAAAARQRILPLRSASPSKVLYVRVEPSLRWMGAQVGGAATHTRGVINGLIANGVALDVVAAERPVGAGGAHYVEAPVKRMLQLIPGLAFTEYSEEIFRLASRLTADFVYQRHQVGTDVGLRLAERLGVPLVLEFNGSEIWIEAHWGSRSVRLGGPLSALKRRNLTDASLVIVVSEALRDIAVSGGAMPDRVLVNPNGVDIEELEPYRSGAASDWRRRAGLAEAPTVGFIGTFGLWHGVSLLPALAETVAGARWVIIGDGPLFADVRSDMTARGVDDRVMMTGLVERDRALELLACCDVCISPHLPNPDGSPFFGSPTKLFEYMGLGKAIVASNLGQIGSVISDGSTGLLCNPGHVPELAAAIQRLLDDPGLRRRLGKAALELAQSEYTWNAHVKRILQALVAGPVAETVAQQA